MRQIDHELSRKAKRFFRKQGMSDPVYIAHNQGEAFAMYGNEMPPRLRRNPYPPGRRHDAWKEGVEGAILAHQRHRAIHQSYIVVGSPKNGKAHC